MVKPVEHDIGSGAATVVGSTAKGVVGGILTMGLLGAALVGGGAALLFGSSALLTGAVIGGLIGTVSGAVTGGVVGGTLGAASGVLKVKDEKSKFNEVAYNQQHNITSAMQQVGQQNFIAGVQEGQQQVVEKLREVQAQQAQVVQTAYHPADDQKGKFADRFQKNSATPEAIAQKREAAAHAAPQVG